MSITWEDQEHEGARFDEAALGDAILRGCRFVRCTFRHADLASILTERCVFEWCDFTGAKLNGAIHEGSAFLNCDFKLAKLFASEFRECKMTGSRSRKPTSARSN